VVNIDEEFAKLDAVVSDGWAAIQNGSFWKSAIGGECDQRLLYKQTMVEIYHYTRHNAVNQAFAAWRASSPEQKHLLKFCFEHADEELGHEQMVVHDLDRAGLLEPGLLEADPLPATQAFIGYLYYVGLSLGPISRLGYSYWAENAYGFLDPILSQARDELDLGDQDMTFFVSHARVDVKHFEEVKEAIAENAETEAHWRGVRNVAATTLCLTGAMLESVLARTTAPVPA
jgi:hypothetical protein